MTPLATLRNALAATTAVVAFAFLGGCATQTTTAAPPAAAVEPGPAMWVVRDADSTIYLFGTVHVLKPELQWRTAKVDRAIAASNELVLEIQEVDDPASMAPLVQKYGLDMTKPLSAKLTAEQNARLAKAAQSAGIPVAALEPMRPWLASVTLLVTSLTKSGFDPNAGVDKLVKEIFARAGKPVRALETAEQQMQFFAGFPEDVEVEMLVQSLDDFEEGAETLDRLARGWAVGDVRVLEDELVDEMKSEAPELYEVLITRRNIDWAEQLERKLAGSGTSFVAVGAGHLVGPDSVQVHLRRKGIRSTRM